VDIVQSSGFRGRWTYELESVAGGTQVTLTEHVVIDAPIVRVVAQIAMSPADSPRRYLGALARRFGEVEPVVAVEEVRYSP
jgi:hypothetical protein